MDIVKQVEERDPHDLRSSLEKLKEHFKAKYKEIYFEHLDCEKRRKILERRLQSNSGCAYCSGRRRGDGAEPRFPFENISIDGIHQISSELEREREANKVGQKMRDQLLQLIRSNEPSEGNDDIADLSEDQHDLHRYQGSIEKLRIMNRLGYVEEIRKLRPVLVQPKIVLPTDEVIRNELPNNG